MTKASEIREFVFCERAWWLRKHNYFGQLKPSDAAAAKNRLDAGIEFHKKYFRDVRSVSDKRRFESWLTWAAVALLLFAALVVALLLSQNAHAAVQVSQTSIPPGTDNSISVFHAPLMIVLAIVLVGASMLAYVARRLRRKARSIEYSRNMPAGAVFSLDDGNARVLTCDALQLVGRVDVVRRVGAHFEVEERKSKRLAPGQSPYRSDVLQLAAYCHLVNRNLGPVKRGFLVYGEARYEIAFNDRLMQELMHTLSKMRVLGSAKTVSRSHKSQPRCTECLARSMCDERLA